VLRIFIALKNPPSWPGFDPATFGSSGQHTNHYTTKATTLEHKPVKGDISDKFAETEQRKIKYL
jgi:hypothetical protein